MKSKKEVSFAEVLLYIGGGVVCLGIAILLQQNWSTFDFTTKILTTLGSGVGAYLVGLLLNRTKQAETVSSAFYLISALVIPVGLGILIDHLGHDVVSYGSQTILSAIVLTLYFTSFCVFRNNIFAFFSIVFGTWFFFALTGFMAAEEQYSHMDTFTMYRTLLVGLAYIWLGHSFAKNEHAPLRGFLFFFGINNVLSAAFALGGMSPQQDIFWEVIYPALLFVTLYLSVRLKSSSFLFFGSIYLIGFVIKITFEYFSKSLSWPLAIIIAGLTIIGVGYMFISLRKKYQ